MNENGRKIRGPTTAWLALTESCNNRCNWCYESKNAYAGSYRNINTTKQLTLNEIQRAIHTLKKCELRRIILIGGEPTLHCDIHNIINFCCAQDIETTLVTNARSASNSEFAKKIADSGLKQATVSLHGWSDKSYEGLQRSSSSHFRQSTEGLLNLRDQGIHVGVNLVLGNHTIKHTSEIVKYLENIEVSQIQFNIAAPAVSPQGVDGSFTADMQEMALHIIEMFQACTNKGIFSSFQLGMPFCLFDKDDLEILLACGAIKQGCHVLYGGGIVIRPNLITAICTHLMEFKLNDSSGEEIFSDEETFLSFWYSNQLEDIRSKANSFRRVECINCSWWDQCGGGCLVHWTYHDPTKFEQTK